MLIMSFIMKKKVNWNYFSDIRLTIRKYFFVGKEVNKVAGDKLLEFKTKLNISDK